MSIFIKELKNSRFIGSVYRSPSRINVYIYPDDDSHEINPVIYSLPLSVFHHIKAIKSFASLERFSKAHDGTSESHIHDLYISNSRHLVARHYKKSIQSNKAVPVKCFPVPSNSVSESFDFENEPLGFEDYS